jgi:hypothetical protein
MRSLSLSLVNNRSLSVVYTLALLAYSCLFADIHSNVCRFLEFGGRKQCSVNGIRDKLRHGKSTVY